MTQSEIPAGLSPDQYALIRGYLAKAWANKDERAKHLWAALMLGDRRESRLAALAQTNEATVDALLAGLNLLKSNGRKINKLFNDFHPWNAFEALGMEVKEPATDDEPAWPRRGELRVAYDTAIRDIEVARGTHQFDNDFYRQVADAVFETCSDALEHFSGWVEQRGPSEKATTGELRATRAHPSANTLMPRLHVISAPMGAGKTTFTMAFAMAMTRLSDGNPGTPQGCLFLVDQIVKADKMYRELEKLLPNKVAIWTTDHDVDCKQPTRVQPAARFHIDQLQDYPVAIVTHALFQGEKTEKARLLRNGASIHRALTLADEQMQDVVIYDVQLSSAQKLREAMQDHGDRGFLVHMDALVKFMAEKEFSKRNLEKPSDDGDSWRVAEELVWFTSDEARHYASANRERWPSIDKVFGFARCMVQDYAFIARRKGAGGTFFMGYEPKHAVVPGMVLLDATADIDGVTPLSPWRTHAEVPRGRYDNLSIVHVNSRTDENLADYLKQAANRKAYAEWMSKVILEQMDPGQLGLVVCKKILLDDHNVPGPFPPNPSSSSSSSENQVFGWHHRGRQLGVTHWGGPGLGSNAWKDAEVVFLFDAYYLPLRTFIAVTQGLQLATTSESSIASMTALNSSSPELDQVSEGHHLRWTKQMALRGRGRVFDEHGVCAKQKVVITGDGSYQRLLQYRDQMFPGAKLIKLPTSEGDRSRHTWKQRLLETLDDPELPNSVTTKDIGERLGVEWRRISKDIMTEQMQEMLRGLGWTYVPRKGRGGAVFQRREH